MASDRFGDDFDDTEEAICIVVDLAELDESGVARDLAELIQRARSWRNRHVSTVD